MELTFAPRNMLQIDGARITHKNFEGRGDKFNREGDRNFSVIIPDEEMYLALKREGWNVKEREPREPGDEPFRYLKVKIKFNDRGPVVFLNSASRVTRLDEESIACVDYIDISHVDMDIRPYDWCVSGSEGRTAYLQSMEVVQNIGRIESRYAEEEHPEE